MDTTCTATPEDSPTAGEYLKATLLIGAACASVALAFTLIGVCHAAGDAKKRLFRRRRR